MFCVRCLDIYPYRVLGGALAIHSACSCAFAMLVTNGDTTANLLVILSLFLFGCVVVWISSGIHLKTASEWVPPEYTDLVSGISDGALNKPFVDEVSDEQPLQPAGLLALATEYGLSARKTRVFLLLMQGRNRSFIQNELFLAEGTVKTHTSHIYRKLGVNNRQDMITVVREKVQGIQTGEGPKYP